MDNNDFQNESIPYVTPIVPTNQIRDLTTTQTQRLLDRLLQELDDENTELDNLEKTFKELSIKANTDYSVWKQNDIDISLGSGKILKRDFKEDTEMEGDDSVAALENHPDMLQQLHHNTSEGDINDGASDEKQKHNARRSLLLSLLHREKKLSRHYESLIAAYQNLVVYTAMHVRERREQNYGISEDQIEQDNVSGSKNGRMKTIQSLQISQSLKLKADALKQNSDLLKVLATQKRKDMVMIQNLIATEAEELAKTLDRENEDSTSEMDF